MVTSENSISAGFPFQSHFIEIKGSKMHYIDEGEGDPILFLHGNPTSSYLWRNIIAHLQPIGRCIAPDLIGMGKSDKPDIDYYFDDHVKYLEEFIEKMELKNITLVIHDWGSGLGFHYASRHEDNVRALVFMEAIVKTIRWADMPKEFSSGFKLLRTPFVGWLMISVMNGFVEKILPQAIVRKLTKEEMQKYREPYPTIKSRKPLRQWPLEIPINGKPERMGKIVAEYSNWLQNTTLPKLLFYARPGAIMTKKVVEWCTSHMHNLEAIDVGKGVHYLQEDHPHLIGKEIVKWLTNLDNKDKKDIEFI